MAQTSDPGPRTRGSAAASSGANGAKGANGNGASGESGARRGFSLSSLSGLLGPRPANGATGANGTRQQRPSTGMGNFLKGWLLLVVGMYVLQIVLYLVDANLFHLWLTTHYVAGTNGGTKPGSLFILGGTSWYLLIFVALFAALYYVLVRLKVLPRDLFGSRSQAQANARTAREARDASLGARNGSSAAVPNPPPLPSGVNPYANRTRAARREAQRRLAASVSATPQPKRGLFGRAKPPAASAAAVPTKKPAQEQTQAAAARPSDTHYQRVRAEQRQRKRRAAKR